MWQDLEERGEVRSCEGPLVGSARGHLGDDFFAAVLEKWVPLADMLHFHVRRNYTIYSLSSRSPDGIKRCESSLKAAPSFRPEIFSGLPDPLKHH